MMGLLGPCPPGAEWFPFFNAVLNVFQAVVLAIVAQRAVRKNREERNGNGGQSH